MIYRSLLTRCLLLSGIFLGPWLWPPAAPAAPTAAGTAAADTIPVWPLERCLQLALENSHQHAAAHQAVAAAEAQHRQARAGDWPQLTLKAGFLRMDEAANFIFPSNKISIGPGASFTVPEQDIKLLDPSSTTGMLGMVWLLFDGGLRSGYRQQADGHLDMVREESRRTDLEIQDTVRRYYYGAILTRRLHAVGRETLERMQATLDLTERMYKEGSGRVKKTDYLSNRVMVESLRSMVASLEKNEAMAQAALANAVGLPWDASVRPADEEIAYEPIPVDLQALVGTAYRFSPDWARLEAGTNALKGAVRTAGSGRFPRVALMGDLHGIWNSYDAGMVTRQNKQGWTIGVGLELSLFDGFLTRNRVAEAKARLGQVEEQGFLLKEGIGVQVRDVFLGLDAARKRHTASNEAMNAATENRDLNERAYQNELVETADVIQSQLVEALMIAQHQLARYDYVTLQSRLNLIVGTEVSRQMGLEGGR